jgi:hypothetical protein
MLPKKLLTTTQIVPHLATLRHYSEPDGVIIVLVGIAYYLKVGGILFLGLSMDCFLL